MVDGATEGCVALPEAALLAILRWLKPSVHPVIEIGTNSHVYPVPPASAAVTDGAVGGPVKAAYNSTLGNVYSVSHSERSLELTGECPKGWLVEVLSAHCVDQVLLIEFRRQDLCVV
jgi:hypothetical protein